MEKLSSDKKLFRLAKLRITGLVMSVVFLIFSGILLTLFIANGNDVSRDANHVLDLALQRVYWNSSRPESGAAEESTVPRQDRCFVVKVTNGTTTFLAGQTNYESYFTKTIPTLDFDTTKTSYRQVGTVFWEATNATLIPGSTDTDSTILYYAGIDKAIEMANDQQTLLTLFYILLPIFVLATPAVYGLAYLANRPMENSVKKEKEFVANASHELKTPIAIISADAQLLTDRVAPNDKKWVETIQGQCGALNETVLDMVELSKLEATKPVLGPVNVSDLYLELALSFEAIAYENGITYIIDIPKGCFLKEASVKDLTRLFNLLLDNALKYAAGDPKSITVALASVKHHYVFSVSNTGCEIPDSDRDRIFDRFYQGVSGSDAERKGSGLGLAIVKTIAERNHYALEVESHYHQGMTFRIGLPSR
jgi:signal transduction histidine kinase